jgi:hypothetical protein
MPAGKTFNRVNELFGQSISCRTLSPTVIEHPDYESTASFGRSK